VIRYALDGAVARITLDRATTKNALDRSGWAELRAAIAQAKASIARVVVVSGANQAFCAGGDLKSIEERLALSRAERTAQLTEDAGAIHALVEMDRPTVAVIDGPAMGAGLALALACDVRLASRRSQLACAFRKVGLAADFGLSWLLPRLVGHGAALDLLYTGEALTADEALRRGIVERVYDDAELAAASEQYISALATGPASLSIMRRVMSEVADKSLAEAISLEAAGQADASRTQDASEGARAFLEKRPPKFTGE
jgi:enoyl-CoA hydratase/carnithine racemase